jgi:hypothetical protein
MQGASQLRSAARALRVVCMFITCLLLEWRIEHCGIGRCCTVCGSFAVGSSNHTSGSSVGPLGVVLQAKFAPVCYRPDCGLLCPKGMQQLVVVCVDIPNTTSAQCLLLKLLVAMQLARLQAAITCWPTMVAHCICN